MSKLPHPPRGFRGAFSTEVARRTEEGRSSGPIRIRPAAVATPADADDVAILVAWASGEEVSLVPRGAGTGMPGGNVGPGVAVDLRALDGLRLDGDGTAAVGPGVVGAALDRAARSQGRFVPALPSSGDRCTLGGMVANNAAGARSFGYGAVRDWVQALEVVLADGSRVNLEPGAPLPPALRSLHDGLSPGADAIVERWPRVRKNASGYALDRFLPRADGVSLLVGSEGTLGIVTGIRLGLPPEPADRAVVLLPVPSRDALAAGADGAEAAGAAACEFLGRRFIEVAGLEAHAQVGAMASLADALLLVELDGARVPVEEGLETLADLAGRWGGHATVARDEERRAELWAVRHAASPVIARQAARGRVSMQFIEDSVVPRDRLAMYLEGLDHIFEEEETDAVVFGHAGDGNVHVNPLIDVTRADWRRRVRRILDATVELVASLGGTLSGEHGDGRIRAPYLERIWGRETATAFAAVKDGLDPRGILNPGVVVPLPGQDPLEGISPEPRR